MQFNGLAKQDEFVANLLNFKTNGIYVDIGSNDSVIANNTYIFDSLNWKGLTIELDSNFNQSYHSRKNSVHLNCDALTIDYNEKFKELDFLNKIDYLSLDVDSLSLDVLNKIPFNSYKFSIITIEHDAYLYGDTYRAPQRSVLHSHGYELICSNVYVEQSGFNSPNSPFEDWYIKPEHFDAGIIQKIKCDSQYPSSIIQKFYI